jgi:hypothetical protein
VLCYAVFETWICTSSTATTIADKRASVEVANALAPNCWSQFNQQANAEGNLVELKAIKSSCEQASFIEKNGAATMPGSARGISVWRLAPCKFDGGREETRIDLAQCGPRLCYENALRR